MPPRPRTDGAVNTVAGSPGCGKTTWTRDRVADAPRLFVWDGKCEWGDDRKFRCQRVTSWAQLHALCLPGAPVARVAFQCVVTRENFERFARLVWVAIRAHASSSPVRLVVEELADVSPPGKASQSWGEIIRKSRAYGADIYALTQRPAESDKTSLGNSALIHCGRLAFADDCRYMANCLRVPVASVESLVGYDFLERNMRTGELRDSRARGRKTRR